MEINFEKKTTSNNNLVLQFRLSIFSTGDVQCRLLY